MTKTFNIGSVGDHANFGEIINNYYYSTPSEFYKSTAGIDFTEIEKQLVDLIFDKAPTKEERIQILNSLRTIKENEGSEGHEESNKQSASKINDFLMAAGTGTAAKILAEYGKDLYKYLTE